MPTPHKHFYITTPIYYVNDKPHIGHAYTTVACDVLARCKRLCGAEVKVLTGTDEHGQKVEKSAGQAGISPQAFADNISEHFSGLTELMQISNDDFIRTTQPRHIKSAQALWARMQERGHIRLGAYAGWYAVRDEAYYQESELVNGKAPTGAEVEWVEEPSYFFNLSEWQEKLLRWYEAHPDVIAPVSRRNEVISFVKGGLKDLSISRTTFSWGIPVPGDSRHIMYVWLDALANYLSALGFPDMQENGEFAHFWPADLHMVGKDILRFHAVYWPAFLMAAELPLPKRIFAHGWWTVEGEKISKSLGNSITAQELVEQYGLDQTRWFLLREVPFGNDGNFSREVMVNRINSELSNNIGNLVQRTLSMVIKHCDGKVPPCNEGVFTPELQERCYGRFDVYCNAMEYQQFQAASDEIIALANAANLFIDQQAPWSLKKTDPEKMEHVLYVLMEIIRCLGILLQPFIPKSSSKILDMLAIARSDRAFDKLNWEHALKPETPLGAPELLFPRLELPASNAG